MPDPGMPTLGVQDYLTGMIDALEFMDDVIRSREIRLVSPYRSRDFFPRSAYMTGEGLVRKIHTFHPGLGDQRGLQRWRPIQISRAADGDDPGVDACAYNPYVVNHGFETVSYSGLQTERRTEVICVKDIRFTWEFEQQLGLIMGMLGDITSSVWENYTREQYIKMAVDNGNAYVLGDGNPTTHAFTYDPFSTDADGDNTIVLDRNINISRFQWNPMRWFRRYLMNQAGQAGLAQVEGRVKFGIIMDLEDFDIMIEKDGELREDFRQAASEVLIADYGEVKEFKGMLLMDDMTAPRFSQKSLSATEMTLKREDPKIEGAAISVGNRIDANLDYINANYALGVLLVREVLEIQVPPVLGSAGGGTKFGTIPSLNGEFYFINNPDNTDNILGEKGYYFGRYEAFAKPLLYHDIPIVFLYQRCISGPAADCDQCGDDAAAAATYVAIKNTSAYAIDADNASLATITLAQCLPAEAGDEVTVRNDADAEVSAVIAASDSAPTYTLAFVEADRPANADMNDVAHAAVKTA